MKKFYEKPSFEVEEFEEVDIVTGSTPDTKAMGLENGTKSYGTVFDKQTW